MNLVKKNFKYLFLLLLLGVTILIWYAVFSETRNGFLTIAFLDVGQGDAIFIDAPSGNQILIDAGPNRKVLSELSKVMPFYDRSLDMVIATHPDADHSGGFGDVLKRFRVGAIMEPGVAAENSAYGEIERLAEEKKVKKILARRGMKILLDENVYLFILFPDRDVWDIDSNDASIVAKLVYDENSFLFGGDSPKGVEKYLAALSPEILKTDILKVGHHGSRTSTSEIFLGYADPEYAVISSGKDNRYGHPHQEVLDILNRFGVKVLRTDELGTIKIASDGEDIEIF